MREVACFVRWTSINANLSSVKNIFFLFLLIGISVRAQVDNGNFTTCESAREDFAHWAPDPNNLDHMPIKIIPVYFHFIRNSDCENNFDDKSSYNVANYSKDLETAINQRLANNVQMTAPVKEGCQTEYIGDTRLRIKVMGYNYQPCDDDCNSYDGITRHNDHPCDCFVKYNVKEENYINIFFMEDDKPEARRGGEAYLLKTCTFKYKYNPDSSSWARRPTDNTIGIRIEGLWGVLQSKDWGIWQAHNVVMHELGHIIGHLGHTWSQRDFGGRPAFDCCDTPRGRGDWQSNNQMDYGMGDRGFTQCQIGYIHRNLTEEYFSYLLDDFCEYHTNNTIYIDSNQTLTWHTPRMLKGDLVIRTGSSLEIKCLLAMPKNSKVVVEAGAKLIVNEGIITNVCDEKFIGIELHKDLRYKRGEEKNKAVLELSDISKISNSQLETYEIDVVRGKPAKPRQIKRFEKKRLKMNNTLYETGHQIL